MMQRDRRSGIAGLAREIGGQRYADPIHHPFGPVEAPPPDYTLALIEAINRLIAKIDAWQPGTNGNGDTGGQLPGACLPALSQAVHFETLSLTTARTLYEITIPGCYDFCTAYSDGTKEGIYVRQRDHSGSVIDLGRYEGFPLLPDVTKLFVTSDVRGGRSTLALGFTHGEPLRVTTQRQIVTAEIYNVAIVGASTYYSTWFNYTNGRLLIDVVSTMDQACTLQVVGNISESYATAKNIGVPQNCPIGSITTSGLDIGLAFDDWHPYIGVMITTAIAPTTGSLVIKALQLSEGA